MFTSRAFHVVTTGGNDLLLRPNQSRLAVLFYCHGSNGVGIGPRATWRPSGGFSVVGPEESATFFYSDYGDMINQDWEVSGVAGQLVVGIEIAE